MVPPTETREPLPIVNVPLPDPPTAMLLEVCQSDDVPLRLTVPDEFALKPRKPFTLLAFAPPLTLSVPLPELPMYRSCVLLQDVFIPSRLTIPVDIGSLAMYP